MLTMNFARTSFVSVAAIASFVACSKPKGPTPANLDTSPTTAAPAQASTAPAETANPAATADSSATYQTVYFDFDSYVVRSDAADALNTIAAALKDRKSVHIQLEGNCDERGSNEYNLALGERRARSVQNFLVSAGVPADVLSTISYGSERPAVRGTGEDVWAKNRRVDFKSL